VLSDDSGAAEMSEWISVKDRLPPDRERVLVYTIDGRMFDACFSAGIWYEINNGWELDFHSMTHWMNLPEPPK
jgi:hypothetical protein